MILGVASPGQAKRIPRPNERGEFGSVGEPVFVLDEFRLASRRVSAQRQDVFDAGGLEFIKNIGDLGATGPDAGEMRHGFDSRSRV